MPTTTKAWGYILAVTLTTVLLVPLSFRYSRMVMRYLLAGFDYKPAVAAAVASRPTAAPPLPALELAN